MQKNIKGVALWRYYRSRIEQIQPPKLGVYPQTPSVLQVRGGVEFRGSESRPQDSTSPPLPAEQKKNRA